MFDCGRKNEKKKKMGIREWKEKDLRKGKDKGRAEDRKGEREEG